MQAKQQFTLGTGVDCTQVSSLNSEPAWINLGRKPKLIFGASSIGLISGAGDIDGLLDLKLRKQYNNGYSIAIEGGGGWWGWIAFCINLYWYYVSVRKFIKNWLKKIRLKLHFL